MLYTRSIFALIHYFFLITLTNAIMLNNNAKALKIKDKTCIILIAKLKCLMYNIYNPFGGGRLPSCLG